MTKANTSVIKACPPVSEGSAQDTHASAQMTKASPQVSEESAQEACTSAPISFEDALIKELYALKLKLPLRNILESEIKLITFAMKYKDMPIKQLSY